MNQINSDLWRDACDRELDALATRTIADRDADPALVSGAVTHLARPRGPLRLDLLHPQTLLEVRDALRRGVERRGEVVPPALMPDDDTPETK